MPGDKRHMNPIIQSDLQTYLRRLIKENMQDKKSGSVTVPRTPAQNRKHQSDDHLQPDNKGESQ